jgi:hypothetical protein
MLCALLIATCFALDANNDHFDKQRDELAFSNDIPSLDRKVGNAFLRRSSKVCVFSSLFFPKLMITKARGSHQGGRKSLRRALYNKLSKLYAKATKCTTRKCSKRVRRQIRKLSRRRRSRRGSRRSRRGSRRSRRGSRRSRRGSSRGSRRSRRSRRGSRRSRGGVNTNVRVNVNVGGRGKRVAKKVNRASKRRQSILRRARVHSKVRCFFCYPPFAQLIRVFV